MSALQQVSADLERMRNTISDALRFVAAIDSSDAAREAHDRVKLAKEWARIRKISRETHIDLLRLEVHLLRKIAQLDVLTAIPAAHRATAKWLRDMSDDEIERLIREYGDASGPVRLMRRALGDDEQARARQRILNGDHLSHDQYVGGEARAEAVIEHARNVKESLAGLLEDYYEGEDGFSVFELAEQVCDSVGLDQRSAVWGTHEGLLEVCRKAVRDSPALAINGTQVPRFVTCIDRSSKYNLDKECTGSPNWLRVPFQIASLDQLDDMVALRQEQADKAAAVAASLTALRDALAAHVHPSEQSRTILNSPPSVTLGELSARVAFAGTCLDDAGAA